MKKTNQLIWLTPITLANLNNLFIKSGAYDTMALNEFISKIVDFVTTDQEIAERFIKKLYDIHPEYKELSFFVEKITIEKPTVVPTFMCPFCLESFKDAKALKEHLTNVEKLTKA
jgi:hypothetical protein